MPYPKPASTTTLWRRNHPEETRIQREHELAKRIAKKQARRADLQRQKEATPPPTKKECSQCGVEKPFCEFNRKKASTDGYRPECRPCQKGYADANKEKRQKRDSQRKDELLAYYKQYRAEHREARAQSNAKTRLKNVAERKAYGIAYRAAHLDFFRLHASRHRALKRGLPDTWTTEQREFMLAYWRHACAICGNQEGLFWILADDHFIPLSSSNCPGTVCTNMIPLCHGDRGCNNSKYNTDAHTWLLRRYSPQRTAKIEKAIAAYFAIVANRFGQATP